jgi:peptide/nickel transport system ATP-binding protein
VLEVRDLKMHYIIKGGSVKAVDGVTFNLGKGEALGIVGESGCGKTSLAMAILRLLTENASFVSGNIFFSTDGDKTDLVRLREEEMRRYRWKEISMIFQAAMNSLNPVYRVGDQISEALKTHFPGISKEEISERILYLFRLVGLDPARMNRYPHEYSGGMKQRAIIAMALVCDPAVVIADEPTTALDVIVQGRILKRLRNIQEESKTSIIYISHDIAAIAQVCDRIAIMYAGKIVELAGTAAIFKRPSHHYTAALMAAFPSITGQKKRLVAIDGEPPDLVNPPVGCRFASRCEVAEKICFDSEPESTEIAENHLTACHFPLGVSIHA